MYTGTYNKIYPWTPGLYFMLQNILPNQSLNQSGSGQFEISLATINIIICKSLSLQAYTLKASKLRPAQYQITQVLSTFTAVPGNPSHIIYTSGWELWLLLLHSFDGSVFLARNCTVADIVVTTDVQASCYRAVCEASVSFIRFDKPADTGVFDERLPKLSRHCAEKITDLKKSTYCSFKYREHQEYIKIDFEITDCGSGEEFIAFQLYTCGQYKSFL